MLQTVTESAIPFSLDEFRDHCSIAPDEREHDPALRRALYAAAVFVESKAGIRLRTSTLYDYFRGIPGPFRFLSGPVNSVTVVRDMTAGADVDPTAWELDLVGQWPSLRSLTDSTWNPTSTYRITWTAGYPTIPHDLHAVVFLVGALYFENREAATPIAMHALPLSVSSILQGYGPRET